MIHNMSNVLQLMTLEVKRFKGEVRTRWLGRVLSSTHTTQTVHTDAVLRDDNKSFVAKGKEARRYLL